MNFFISTMSGTCIDHDADHRLSIADGAAPQQQVPVLEADSDPVGVFPVEVRVSEEVLNQMCDMLNQCRTQPDAHM